MLLPDGSETELRRAVEAREEELEVRVVAPAHVGPLGWLASDVDDALREADVRALAAEWALGDRASVEAQSGDVDPVLAVEDALATFPADEILVVGGAAEDGVLDRSLRRFRLPVERLGGPPPEPGHAELREAARAVVAGRSRATPFVFFAGVNLFLLLLAALVAAAVLLVLWLSY